MKKPKIIGEMGALFRLETHSLRQTSGGACDSSGSGSGLAGNACQGARLLPMKIDLLRLGCGRSVHFFQLHGRVLEVRLLRNRIPVEQGKLIGCTGPAGMIPVAEMEWDEEVARLDVPDLGRCLGHAPAG